VRDSSSQLLLLLTELLLMSELRFDHVTYEGAIFLWQSFRCWRDHAAQTARFQQVRKRLFADFLPGCYSQIYELVFLGFFGKKTSNCIA
jgi:hypothetical protein